MDAILDLIKEDVKADGYELTYHNFTGDHVKPNLELQAKNFDANMMQHEFFMESFNKGNNGSLVHFNEYISCYIRFILSKQYSTS